MLTITDLGKIYPTGTKALNNVSFTVDQPQVIAIIGPSGAGITESLANAPRRKEGDGF